MHFRKLASPFLESVRPLGSKRAWSGCPPSPPTPPLQAHSLLALPRTGRACMSAYSIPLCTILT